MFIEKQELYTAIYEQTLGGIVVNEAQVGQAINAAIQEATSYLNSRYDCTAIFSAVGEARNALVLEHCKSMAVWYILRVSNAGIIYDKAKDYYELAIEWFKRVAGVSTSGKPIAADLPLKQVNGEVKMQLRAGSNPKFNHSF